MFKLFIFLIIAGFNTLLCYIGAQGVLLIPEYKVTSDSGYILVLTVTAMTGFALWYYFVNSSKAIFKSVFK